MKWPCLIFYSQTDQIYKKKWLHTQPKVSNTITIGKQQRKCRTHQILLVFPAVLTQLFWLPLSVNHLHITNLIQHFFTECFQVSTQYTGTGHTVISRHYLGGGVCIANPRLFMFMTITNKKLTFALLFRVCTQIPASSVTPSKFSWVNSISFCSSAWPEDNFAPNHTPPQPEPAITQHTCTRSLAQECLLQPWKQPLCSSTGKWLKKLRYSFTAEFYIALTWTCFQAKVTK